MNKLYQIYFQRQHTCLPAVNQYVCRKAKTKKNEMLRVYAVAFLAVLLLKKNIPATAPNIATRTPINKTVSLIFVPNMGVPDP
jgi:hypothetical protein